MSAQLIPILSKQLNLPSRSVQNTLTLLDEGATVPFISRYRKEMTGSLDEVQVGNVKEAYQRLQELLKRRQSILESIREQGQLTAELEEKINNTWSATELEDIYLPYKPKRKTRASVAREKGLEPLAGTLMKQDLTDVYSFAERVTSAEVADAEEALAGARDIMAEWINERAYARNTVRRLFEREATITSKLVKGKEEEGTKYSDYFQFSEALKRIPSHRMLALRRAEEEGIIRVSIAPPEEKALDQLERIFVKGRNEAAEQVKMAVKDAYKRLLAPSIETEFRLPSAPNASWPLIPVSVPAVKWCAWMNRATCCTTKIFTLTRHSPKAARQPPRSAISWKPIK